MRTEGKGYAVKLVKISQKLYKFLPNFFHFWTTRIKFPSVTFMLFLLEQSIKSFQFILFLEENERMEKYENMISAQLKLKKSEKT